MTETSCLSAPTTTTDPAATRAAAVEPGATSATSATGTTGTAEIERTRALEASEGWQALALAVLDRELTEPELAATERLPVETALDLLFPDLDDAARHEALWALDRPPA